MPAELSPMLASHAPDDLSTLRYPAYVSAKIDGIRAIMNLNWARSRSMTNIPNRYTQTALRQFSATTSGLEGLDGELIAGSDPTAPGLMQKCTSAFMTIEGEPEFKYLVFDLHNMPGTPYRERYAELSRRVKALHAAEPIKGQFISVLPQQVVENVDQLLDFEKLCLGLGYEGVMYRRTDGFYKFGKSTVGQGFLLKLKRVTDSEAVITGYEEAMENTNPDTRSRTGKAKRSTAKAGMKPKGMLGVLIGNDVKTGQPVRVGPGKMTKDMQRQLWIIREQLPGLYFNYRHFDICGVKEGRRIPIFHSFRDPMDFDI